MPIKELVPAPNVGAEGSKEVKKCRITIIMRKIVIKAII